MAPRKLTQIERWIGTEAERLALDASGFSPGSTFFERDTGSMHKWDGTSWGKEIITVADIAGIKTAIESLDNKELATELTLAQILTILGGTAADIGTLKLENGQIKGYDGTDWQPVRVNDAGELILASEVTVNAEGLSVDLGKLVLQAKNPSGVPVDMKSDTEGNLKVSLSGTISELQTDLLAAIAYNTSMSSIKVSSWSSVQHIVRAGLGDKVFQIADQIVTEFAGVPVVADVIGINHDKPSDPRFQYSLTVQFHDCLLDAQFSAPQALYYAEAVLPAGEHRFTLDNVQHTFTTSQVVPAGGQVFISGWGTEGYVPTTITTYAADRTTSIETGLVVTQSAGSDTLAQVNHHQKCRYGSNNYVESAIKQWLTSDAANFEWIPKTNYDRPSTYSGGGFLHQLDPDLVAVLGAVDKQVTRNTVTDGGGQDLFSDKVFLLSRVEVYGGTEGETGGEAPYPYYESLASSPTAATLDGRIKYLGASARGWWLRFPYPGYASDPRYVSAAGQVGYYGASNSLGAAPACTII